MHFNAVVADLGLSRFKEESGKMSHAVGCLPWTAPEVFRGEKYTETADVYSFAMVIVNFFRIQRSAHRMTMRRSCTRYSPGRSRMKT
jgi:serine/threonine protein kinase